MRHRLAADRVRVSPTRSDCAGRRAGRLTERITFMVAVRSGVLPDGSGATGEYRIGADPGPNLREHRGGAYAERSAPTATSCRTTGLRADGRVSLDLPVALERRGARDVCGRIYKIENAKLNTPFVSNERRSPEIFLGGNSEAAEQLALKHADCLWRLPDTPERLRPASPRSWSAGPSGSAGVDDRQAHQREEVAAAYQMIEDLGKRRDRRTPVLQPIRLGGVQIDADSRTKPRPVGSPLICGVAPCRIWAPRPSRSWIGRRHCWRDHGVSAGWYHAVPLHGLARPPGDDVFQPNRHSAGASKGGEQRSKRVAEPPRVAAARTLPLS
ncbi:MAG: hypothetical protein Udaeo2_25460 [Candidatus Udaeobacter sp.]|nr:MAG: hypothetical protein Udaeo2_25460 [Candidatus Udaeobacter sp.]